MLAVDDWVHGPFLDSAEVVDAPITWFIDPSENDGGGEEANRHQLMLRAHSLGHEIAAHTIAAVTCSTNVQQARQIFAASRDWITAQLGEAPVSWTYYGNDWNRATQSVVRDYFPGVIRLRTNSVDNPPVFAYRSEAAAYPAAPPGLPSYGCVPFPLAQYRLDQIVYTGRLCTRCTDSVVDEDTAGTWDFFEDLVRIRGVAISSVHPVGDISATQFAQLLRTAKSRGDIWLCTARQFYETFGQQLRDDRPRVIHASPDGAEMGCGTPDEPLKLQHALFCWDKLVQLKDTTYQLEELFGPEQDLVLSTNLFLRGPATLVADLSGHGPTATNIILNLSPANSNYTGYRGGLRKLRIELVNCDNLGSQVDAGVSIVRSHAEVDSCEFSGCGSAEAALIYGSAANLQGIRIRWNTFELPGAGTCAAVQRSSATGMTGWCIAQNEVHCLSSGNKYGVLFASAASAEDSVLNNRFVNDLGSSTFYGLRFLQANAGAPPYYAAKVNGNEWAGPVAKLWLRSGVKNLASDQGAGLDSLAASSLDLWGRKMYWSPSTEVNDTTRFGGVCLPWLGAGSYWSSIGCRQYGGTGGWLERPALRIGLDESGRVRLSWNRIGPQDEVRYRILRGQSCPPGGEGGVAFTTDAQWIDPQPPCGEQTLYYTVTGCLEED